MEAKVAKSPLQKTPKNKVTLSEVVDIARAYIGNASALSSVQSIQYRGKLEAAEGEGSGELFFVYEKPARQKVVFKSQSIIDITAINDTEGFQMQFNKETQQYRRRILSFSEFKKFRIFSLENLYFYKLPDSVDVRQEFLGVENYKPVSGSGDSRKAYRFLTKYPEIDEQFDRLIDVDSGRLLSNRLSGGIELIEEGEIVVKGVRFPKSVKTYRDGKLQHTVTFQKIIVNGKIPKDAFDVPMKPLEYIKTV